MNAPVIRVESLGTPAEPVGVLTLDRPDRRNALTPQLQRDLTAAAISLSNTTRVLVLRGEGKVFCAGFDLWLCKDSPDGSVMRELLTGLSDLVRTLRDLPIPVVVAAHGGAIAGGCAILGGADFVITNDDAVLGYPVVKLGVSPAISAPFMRLSMGDAPTRERQLDPTLISGRDAARAGLASESLPTPEDVWPRALAIAGELAQKPPGAVAATRRWVREIETARRPDDTAAALNASLSLTGGREEQELLAAFWGAKT